MKNGKYYSETFKCDVWVNVDTYDGYWCECDICGKPIKTVYRVTPYGKDDDMDIETIYYPEVERNRKPYYLQAGIEYPMGAECVKELKLKKAR